MGDEERQALAQLFADNEAFKAAILGATSVDDAVRIAGEHGIAASAEDFAMPDGGELGDAHLEHVAGGIPQSVVDASLQGIRVFLD